jgi:hypothetical protein
MGSGQSAPTLPAAPTMPSPTSMTTSSLSPSSIAPPPNKCTDPAYPDLDDGPNGETCYGKCPDGYYRYFAACIPNDIPVPVKREATKPLPPSPCPPGKILEFGWCYEPCPKDMKGDPQLCIAGDPHKFKLAKMRNVPLPK